MILDTHDGQIKVADLGLARLPCAAAGEGTAGLTAGMKGTGTLTPENAGLIGTADYLAPEQALDFHQADIRSDIYSLGCTLYFLLTGQPPFPGGNLAQKVAKHLQAEPVPVEQLRPGLPPQLSSVVRKMLAKRPEERYQKPGEVVQALGPFAEGRYRTVRPGNRLRFILGKQRRLVAAAGVLLFLGLGLLVGFRGLRLTPPGKHTVFRARTLRDIRLPSSEYAVGFSQHAKFIASSGGNSKTITLWNPATGEQLFTLSGEQEQVSHLTFSANGRFLVSGSGYGQTWRIWDLEARRGVASGRTDDAIHPDHTFFGPFSPDGRYLVIHQARMEEDKAKKPRPGKTRVEEIGGSGIPAAFRDLEIDGNAAAISPDSKTLAEAGVPAKGLALYDLATGKEKAAASQLGGFISVLVFAPDAKILAIPAGGGKVRFLDASTLKEVKVYQRHGGDIADLAFSADGLTVATSGFDSKIKLWDPASGEERATLPGFHKPVRGLTFNSDGTGLIAAGFLKAGDQHLTVRVWRLRRVRCCSVSSRTRVSGLLEQH